MSISGINDSYSLANLLKMYGTQSTSSVSSTTSSTSSTSSSSVSSSSLSSQVDSLDLSKPGEMMSKLKQLKASDPEKFKELCTKMAEKLKEAADKAGDTTEGKMLSELAAKFQNVADGGDISQLEPPKPPPPPSGSSTGINAYSQNSISSLADMLKSNNSQDKSKDTLMSLMSDFMAEVDSATNN